MAPRPSSAAPPSPSGALGSRPFSLRGRRSQLSLLRCPDALVHLTCRAPGSLLDSTSVGRNLDAPPTLGFHPSLTGEWSPAAASVIRRASRSRAHGPLSGGRMVKRARVVALALVALLLTLLVPSP